MLAKLSMVSAISQAVYVQTYCLNKTANYLVEELTTKFEVVWEYTRPVSARKGDAYTREV